MQSHRRTFDRTIVAKLSDVRERLHAIVERAQQEREHDAETSAALEVAWPRDINAPDEEVSRG